MMHPWNEGEETMRRAAIFCLGLALAWVVYTLAIRAYAHGDGHRPDDNEKRHKCHHWLVYCAKKCHEIHGTKQPDLDACLNHCLGGWGRCVEKAEK